MRVAAYSPFWRLLTAALLAVAGANLLALLAAVLLSNDPPVTPPVLVRTFVLATVLPAAVAWLLDGAFASTMEVAEDGLVIRRRDVRVEVPLRAIADVIPWRVPLPRPGLTIALPSGRRLRYRVATDDPQPALAALAAAGCEAAGRALASPAVAWAHARASVHRRWWTHPLVKFVLFACAPAAIVFYTHQSISYGGLLGQYHLEGPGPWLSTLAAYWTAIAIYLVLYAAAWRTAAEGAALVTTVIAPARAAGIRRGVEVTADVAFYAGVAVILGLRYLA